MLVIDYNLFILIHVLNKDYLIQVETKDILIIDFLGPIFTIYTKSFIEYKII